MSLGCGPVVGTTCSETMSHQPISTAPYSSTMGEDESAREAQSGGSVAKSVGYEGRKGGGGEGWGRTCQCLENLAARWTTPSLFGAFVSSPPRPARFCERKSLSLTRLLFWVTIVGNVAYLSRFLRFPSPLRKSSNARRSWRWRGAPGMYISPRQSTSST